MCLRDVMLALRAEGICVSETQVRWAINSGKVSRPPLDGSLRFDFRPEHLRELVDYLRAKRRSTGVTPRERRELVPA